MTNLRDWDRHFYTLEHRWVNFKTTSKTNLLVVNHDVFKKPMLLEFSYFIHYMGIKDIINDLKNVSGLGNIYLLNKKDKAHFIILVISIN